MGDRIVTGYAATDGALWFPVQSRGSAGSGLLRYDGRGWTHYGEFQGLSVQPEDLAEWPAGTLWVGVLDGVSWADLHAVGDSTAWRHKTDFGLGHPKMTNLTPAPDALWLAPIAARNAGAVRYDGETWRTFTEADGMAGSGVSQILRGGDGMMWFIGPGGVSRYDGENWFCYTEEDGLPLSRRQDRPLPVCPGAKAAGDGAGACGGRGFTAGKYPPDVVRTQPVGRDAAAGYVLPVAAGRRNLVGLDAPDGLYVYRVEFRQASV